MSLSPRRRPFLHLVSMSGDFIRDRRVGLEVWAANAEFWRSISGPKVFVALWNHAGSLLSFFPRIVRADSLMASARIV